MVNHLGREVTDFDCYFEYNCNVHKYKHTLFSSWLIYCHRKTFKQYGPSKVIRQQYNAAVYITSKISEMRLKMTSNALHMQRTFWPSAYTLCLY